MQIFVTNLHLCGIHLGKQKQPNIFLSNSPEYYKNCTLVSTYCLSPERPCIDFLFSLKGLLFFSGIWSTALSHRGWPDQQGNR